MVVSFMGTLCVLWLIVRFMVAAVRFMVNCAFYGYCAFYGLYKSSGSCMKKNLANPLCNIVVQYYLKSTRVLHILSEG